VRKRNSQSLEGDKVGVNSKFGLVQNVAKWIALIAGLVFFIFENMDGNYHWISWMVLYSVKPDPPFLWRLFALPTFSLALLSGVISLPKWQGILGLLLVGAVFLRVWAFR
jgi:hypothetical protein